MLSGSDSALEAISEDEWLHTDVDLDNSVRLVK